MFKDWKFIKKLNVVDFVIIGIVFVLILSALAVKNGLFKTGNNKLLSIKPVEFTVVTRAYDVTGNKKLFKKGEKTFITIRNVPYTELEIARVKVERVKEMFFNEDRPEVPYVITNGAYPHRVQYIVTLKDKAHITKDGAVIGGNKIKIGLPIDLEGFNYRLSGTVSSVKVIEE